MARKITGQPYAATRKRGRPAHAPLPGLPGDMRSRLVMAATVVFACKGYASASVREIVTAAGVTKPVLYYYFQNKESLFLGIMNHVSETLEVVLEKAQQQPGAASERIRRLCVDLLGHYVENLDVVKVMNAVYYGAPQGAPEVDFHALHDRLRAVLASMVRDGFRAGEFGSDSVDDVVWGVLGILNVTLETQLCHPERSPGARGMERALDVFFAGARMPRRMSKSKVR